MKSLENKCAIVTGGAGGLGRAIVTGLIAEGANVVVVDVDQRALDEFQPQLQKLSANGAAFEMIVADIAKPDDCEMAVVSASKRFGGPHVLVNNAAMGMQHIRDDHMTRLVTIDELDPSTWQRFVDVNLSGAFFMTRAAVAPMLRQKHGRIIDITTSFFTMMRGKFHPYGPTKAGMEAMAAGHAVEFENTGVTVNVVVPGGPADTPMVPAVSGMAREDLIPPAAMVAPIVWLASDDAADTTGQRYIAAHWDESLPQRQAAAACAAPIGWPELAQAPVWPGGNPDS